MTTLQIQFLDLYTAIPSGFDTHIDDNIAFGAGNPFFRLPFTLPATGGAAHGHNIVTPQKRLPTNQRQT
jgi:hypothetical protein